MERHEKLRETLKLLRRSFYPVEELRHYNDRRMHFRKYGFLFLHHIDPATSTNVRTNLKFSLEDLSVFFKTTTLNPIEDYRDNGFRLDIRIDNKFFKHVTESRFAQINTRMDACYICKKLSTEDRV